MTAQVFYFLFMWKFIACSPTDRTLQGTKHVAAQKHIEIHETLRSSGTPVPLENPQELAFWSSDASWYDDGWDEPWKNRETSERCK